jgi:adenylosuccinate synthase
MMLDVFSTFAELKICTAYELDGEQITNFPFHADDLRRVKPVYESLPGWEQDITRVQSIDDLPANARSYVDRIGELLERSVEIVSVGPARDQTIFVERELVRA